jgi:hypothetical protein
MLVPNYLLVLVFVKIKFDILSDGLSASTVTAKDLEK